MGFESRASALRRHRFLAASARDAWLREELARCVAGTDVPGDPAGHAVATDPLDSHELSAPGLAHMQTPAAPRHVDASFTPWADAAPSESRPAPGMTLGLAAPVVDQGGGLRFPVQQLCAELATAATVRALLAALAEQSRAIALVREAHALGAATLPPEVAATLERAGRAALI